MTEKRVVLLSGPQGSGKSTLARLLGKMLNAPTLKFAAPLYEMHEAIRKVAGAYMIPFEKKEGRLLQLLGAEWGRQTKGDDVWVKAAKSAADIKLLASPYVIFDDCRFPNEAEAFGKLAYKARLTAPTEIRKLRAEGWREIPHESETALDDYDKWDVQFDTSSMEALTCARWIIGDIGATKYVERLWGSLNVL